MAAVAAGRWRHCLAEVPRTRTVTSSSRRNGSPAVTSARSMSRRVRSKTVALISESVLPSSPFSTSWKPTCFLWAPRLKPLISPMSHTGCGKAASSSRFTCSFSAETVKSLGLAAAAGEPSSSNRPGSRGAAGSAADGSAIGSVPPTAR